MKTEVLTQEEINQLLTPVSSYNSYNSIEDFEDFLVKRNFPHEKRYGIFDKNIPVCKFFDSENNEKLLEDIRQKNEQQGYGNITIPNTNITLINYSFCYNCKTIFSFKELVNYYANPKPDQKFNGRAHQYREDTRVCCKNCGTYFLPSLIISDGTPKKEVQFLCRVQTIDAVEKYFSRKNIKVLTKKKENIVRRDNLTGIKNDVYIKDLVDKPTLITNIVQYTPVNLIMNLIDGTNVEKGDLLFDEWK